MSGTVEVDDSSLAPTASSILIGRGMKTAFLMICKPLFDRCLCVCVRVCVSLGAATCVLQEIVIVRCWYD